MLCGTPVCINLKSEKTSPYITWNLRLVKCLGVGIHSFMDETSMPDFVKGLTNIQHF